MLMEQVATDESDHGLAPAPTSIFPDPRYLWMLFQRRIWIFVAIVVLTMGAVVAYTLLATTRYSASATILVEPPKGDPVKGDEDGGDSQPVATSGFIDTQILIVDSPKIAAEVVRALDLVSDPEFSAAPSDVLLDVQDEKAVERARVVATAQVLQSAVAIRRIGQTSIIEVEAHSKSPMQAARIANEYVRQYIESTEQARLQARERTTAQIDGKLDRLRQAAEAADADLQRYKIANGLMSAQGATMAEQETSSLNQQIATARATLAERQGRLEAARRQLLRGGGGEDVGNALSSGTIGALRAEEAESSRNLAQLRARYGDRHPSIIEAQDRLADVRRQIQAEINRILSSMEAEVNVAQSGLSSLLGSQSASQARLAGNAAAQVGYLEFERKAEAARTTYELFLRSSRSAAAREGIQPPIASVASAATIPTSPSSPNVRLAYLLGTVMALIFGIGGIALAEYLDGGISTKIDIERRLRVRYLGAIPEVASTLEEMREIEDPQDYLVSHPLSSFAEALRSLHASLTLRGHSRPKVIAVTSPLPREGKTTTAVCLARALAMSGASTVLVDCDLRRHSSSDMLLAGRQGNLLPVLAGEQSVDMALIKDEMTGLLVLGTSAAPSDGRDFLAPDLVRRLLEQLRARFDYVVIDTAPVLGIADARSVASQADVVLLLARWRQTSLRAADTALELLISAKAKVAGVALTLVDVRKFSGTGGEDMYDYHKKFKGYYVN